MDPLSPFEKKNSLMHKSSHVIKFRKEPHLRCAMSRWRQSIVIQVLVAASTSISIGHRSIGGHFDDLAGKKKDQLVGV